ncbi:MAG: D-alanyl-D-alanine carboxypeptidase [Deltaproteobacteria bacterium]|nr:D-alanyl-D-alanine carboxypeptidase [Deltaproteobacteria bacterium]
MRMQRQVITVVGVLVCFLSGMVEQSFARQANTSQRAALAKKSEKKATKKTLAVPSGKKQTASSRQKPALSKREEKSPQAIRRETRTRKPEVQSERRLAKARPQKRTVSRFQRRRASVRVVSRTHRTPRRVVQQSEPTIVKDYESMILADAENGRVLLTEEIDKQWPAASLTKMMVGLLALEDIARERFSLQTSVVMSGRAASARGRTIGLREGEEFSLGELLQAMLVTSANDASVAVAERIRGSVEACVTAMNRRAQRLGMTQTEFQTVNGMPLPDGSAGDFSSARDLVILTRALLRHDLVLEWTSHDKIPFRDGSQMLPNTNRLVGRVAGVTGLKTGFTSRARFNLVATAQRGSLSLIAVILGGRNSRIRFESAEQFLEWGFTNYRDPSASFGVKRVARSLDSSFPGSAHSRCAPLRKSISPNDPCNLPKDE